MTTIVDKAIQNLEKGVRAIVIGESAPFSGSGSQTLTSTTGTPGMPARDISHSLNIGGHVLASDSTLMEKQQSFNRCKIVERMVHPCGSGAFGNFQVTGDVAKYTKAKFLQPGKTVPVFVRFSTVTLGREFPDSARNPRGFAIKFYTEDGNYDLVGLSWPVFFNRDPAQGPDVIRSQQRRSDNFLLNFEATFDFLSCVPESMHAGLMFMSNHGTPVGWRFMNGYGVHTFAWVNEAGERVFVKYHFEAPESKQFTFEEAVKMCGEDPDFAKRDLWDHIEKGGKATWKAYVQIMTVEEASRYKYDPFDCTKVWEKKDFPLIPLGELVLDRNPTNYHRDVEQVAFSPGSMVPGIEPSPDPLLQWRMFLYRDAQMYRLGSNLHQIPVNCPVMSTHKLCPFALDGKMRVDRNGEGQPTYFPNSIGPRPDVSMNETPLKLPPGSILARKASSIHEGNLDEDLQPCRELWNRSMSQQERQDTCRNIAKLMVAGSVRREIRLRYLGLCWRIDPALAFGVADLLGDISREELEQAGKSYKVDSAKAYEIKGGPGSDQSKSSPAMKDKEKQGQGQGQQQGQEKEKEHLLQGLGGLAPPPLTAAMKEKEKATEAQQLQRDREKQQIAQAHHP